MNISSPVLYGAAVAIGIAGGALTGLAFSDNDRASQTKFRDRVAAMSPDELRDAVLNGTTPPSRDSSEVPIIAGATTMMAGSVCMALVGTANGIGGFFSMFSRHPSASHGASLRPGVAMVAAGIGAMVGSLLVTQHDSNA